jgi:hypothetical protein
VAPTQSRTQWAERQAEELLSAPFISEFVFRSPQTIDASQKEVADLLILHKGNGLLVSQKAQEDPESRSDGKNELWVLKAARKGANQLLGAMRPSSKAIWCDHPRRGRVDFPAGLPPIAHGLVSVETLRPVDLQAAALELPLSRDGVPISYFSLSDFFNVALQLRTVPELLRYLDARKDLPEAAQRRLGDELVLFEFYLLRGTFAGCLGHGHAKATVGAEASELAAVLERFEEYHHFSGLLEHVADSLATRSATCLDGLTPELAAHFDAPDERVNYLLMQEVLADLPLRERAALGKQFADVCGRSKVHTEGYRQATAHIDSRPEWIFVFGSSRGWARESILRSIERVMRGALARYRKQRCMVLIDRDGEGYEVAIKRPGELFIPTTEDLLNGRTLFAELATRSVPVEGF